MLFRSEILLEHGIERDSSIFPAERGHGGYEDFGSAQPSLLNCPAGKMKEFPISLGQVLGKNIVFSGGGYFRLMPFWMIRRLTSRSDYVMTYFHPRDFDPAQPRLNNLSMKRKFMSYVGLSSSHDKLERLLSDFKFMSLGQAYESLDLKSLPKVKL